MGAEGVIQQMISSYRNNRGLLNKSGKARKYQHFDKSYITDWIISRKTPKFKTATPEYLQQLKEEMKLERKKDRRRKLLAAIVTLVIATGVLILIFLKI